MKYEDLKGKEYKYVLRIEWEDACSDAEHGWLNKNDMESLGLEKVINWGCLTEWNERYITLHGSQGESDILCTRFTIPRYCITKIKKIDNV